MVPDGAGRALVLLLISTAALHAPDAAASPWGREPADVFISTRAEYFRAEASGPAPGAERPQRFERYETHLYGEIGLGGGVTAGGKAIYGTSAYDDGYDALSADGFSELEGFAQYRFWQGRRHVAALRLAAVSPARLDTGVRPGFERNGAALDARLLAGTNLMERPVKIFAALEAGYRRSFSADADEVRADALIGVEPTRRLLFLAEVFSTTAVSAAGPGGADYDIVKTQASAVWRFSRRWAAQAGATHEVAGRGVLLGRAYFLSLWTSF